MGAIEGVIVLSSSNEPILHSHFTHPLVSYPSLHTDQLVAKLEASRASDEDLLPVLFTEGIPSVISEDDDNDDDGTQSEQDAQSKKDDGMIKENDIKEKPPSGAALVHVEHNRLRFVATFSQRIDPLVPLTFLRTLLVNLELYLGSPLTEEAIRENIDVVYQILEEMLDESGQPLNTEYNTLRELVREPSWLGSVINKVGALSGISTNAALGHAVSQPHISPIAWRRPATSITQRSSTSRNEMYVDIVEQMSGVYSRQPHARAIGPIRLRCRLEANCRLGQTPDVLLRLNDVVRRITDASLHPCVRLRQWKKEHALSFIPPEGQFTLADFEMESVGALERHVPISLQCTRDEPSAVQRGHKDVTPTTFRIVLGCNAATTVEDVEVTFGVGEKSCSIESALSGGSRPSVASEDLNTLKGTFHFDAKLGMARWTVGKLTSDQRPLELSGRIKTDVAAATQSAHLSTSVTCRFTVSHKASLSGLKVAGLEIVNDVGYTPTKGVRFLLKGDIDWRW